MIFTQVSTFHKYRIIISPPTCTHFRDVMKHGHHIYQTESEMDMSKMYAYPPSQNALPHWKCVLCCCEGLPHIDITGKESDS